MVGRIHDGGGHPEALEGWAQMQVVMGWAGATTPWPYPYEECEVYVQGSSDFLTLPDR